MNFFKKLFNKDNSTNIDFKDPLYIFMEDIISAINDDSCQIDDESYSTETYNILFKHKKYKFCIHGIVKPRILLDDVELSFLVEEFITAIENNEGRKKIMEERKKIMEEIKNIECNRKKLLAKISTSK